MSTGNFSFPSTSGGGGGGGSGDEGYWIREQISATMTEPLENNGQNFDLDVAAGGPGPYIIESYLIVQVGGTYDGGMPSLNLAAYLNAARSTPYWGNFASPPMLLPSTGTWGVIGFDLTMEDKIRIRINDNSFSFQTVQYQIFLTIRRPAGLTDNV